MSQDRLNHLLLLYCHKTRADAIDLTRIASSFVSVNDRHLQYFGSVLPKMLNEFLRLIVR